MLDESRRAQKDRKHNSIAKRTSSILHYCNDVILFNVTCSGRILRWTSPLNSLGDYACALQSIPGLFSTPTQMKRPGYEATSDQAAWTMGWSLHNASMPLQALKCFSMLSRTADLARAQFCNHRLKVAVQRSAGFVYECPGAVRHVTIMSKSSCKKSKIQASCTDRYVLQWSDPPSVDAKSIGFVCAAAVNNAVSSAARRAGDDG